LLALAADVLVGDPPDSLHPVAWFGRVAGIVESRAPAKRAGRLVYGFMAALVLPALYATLFRPRSVGGVPGLRAALSVLALKSTFAIRGLLLASRRVREALEAGDIEAARCALSALVSRDAGDLEREGIVSATIESLAVNTVDSFLAPWLFYMLFGVEGALAFRGVNTLDAMWGYRTAEYEDLGKDAALLDDALAYAPATLAARLIICAGALVGRPPESGFRVLRRDGGATASPNAGRPMSAMAGILGTRLSKEGEYVLGNAGRPLEPELIREAERIVRVTAALGAGISALLLARQGR